MNNNLYISVVNVKAGTCVMQDNWRVIEDKGCTTELFAGRSALIYPELFHSMNSSLAASPADRVSHTSTSAENKGAGGQSNSQVRACINDIYSTNLISKQKKEVYEFDMVLKHCKTFQCKTNFTLSGKIFNN